MEAGNSAAGLRNKMIDGAGSRSVRQLFALRDDSNVPRMQIP